MNFKLFATLLIAFILSVTIFSIIYADEYQTSPLADQEWVRLGGPLGGLGYDIRMDPRDPAVMYVTDAFTGVFKSTNGGQTWFPSNNGITTRVGVSGDAIPVFCLTIDPNNPDTLWIGTQGVRGLFRSGDAGQNWVKMDQGIIERDGITFRGFTVEPGNSDVVYAAAEISSWAWASEEIQGREFDLTKGVIYKTINGGLEWNAVWRGDNLARYIWIDPRDTQVLYISTGIFDREAANSNPAAGIPGGEGILKSLDGGETWAQVNNGLENLFVGSLFMHPENPDILIAGAHNNQYHQGAGVYLTVDSGQNWEQTLSNVPIESVEFSISDPNVVYAGGEHSVFRSDDGGLTWQQVSESDWGPPGVRVGFPIDFQVDPRDPNRIFTNAYGGGNFLSHDGGLSWEDASKGYTGAQVRAVAVDPKQPGRVYAAARSGIFVSHNGGIDWIGLNSYPAKVMEWNAVAISPADSNLILAANNWNNAILVSDNGGQTWKKTDAQIDEGIRSGWSTISFAPSDPKIVYAGTAGFFSAGSFDPSVPGRGIFKSLDGGEHWKPINTENTENAHIQGLAVDPKNELYVVAASTNKGILSTQDGGKTWSQVAQGVPSEDALSISISPHSSSIMLAGFDRRGLYRSEDNGASWVNSTIGMNPEAKVTSIVFDPSNEMVVYAADENSGVYYSDDMGKTWQQLINGLDFRSVTSLTISSDGLDLYAGVEGGGVYRLSTHDQAYFNSLAPTSMPILKPESTPTHVPTEIVYQQDFENGNAPEWHNDPGWKISQIDNNFVLAGNGHVWTELVEHTWDDFILRFRLNLVEGQSEIHTNIRRGGNGKRYFIYLSNHEVGLSKQTGPNEFQEGLVAGPGIGIGWNDMEIYMLANNIRVLADGNEILNYTDDDVLPAGGVAFESLGDSLIYIDDVEVSVPAQSIPEEASTPTQSTPVKDDRNPLCFGGLAPLAFVGIAWTRRRKM